MFRKHFSLSVTIRMPCSPSCQDWRMHSGVQLGVHSSAGRVRHISMEQLTSSEPFAWVWIMAQLKVQPRHRWAPAFEVQVFSPASEQTLKTSSVTIRYMLWHFHQLSMGPDASEKQALFYLWGGALRFYFCTFFSPFLLLPISHQSHGGNLALHLRITACHFLFYSYILMDYRVITQ